MATWNSRGLRGSTLEDLINRTNEKYREQGLALIQKVPTPITPIKIDKEHRHITLAYFEQKSTVDYIGAVQGIPVCFDAKECVSDAFPLQNIHPHQVQFMEDFEKQEGIAFLILLFSQRNELYYLSFRRMKESSVEIPVIFLTASGYEDDVRSAISLGAVNYLKKPFFPNELLKRVAMGLEEQ